MFSLLETIPLSVGEQLLRFGSDHWDILSFLARCPGAFDLVRSNAALGFALAQNYRIKTPKVTQPMRSARALAKRKQREICAWLGFPGTERVVRILRKIHPKILDVIHLRRLRKALWESPEALKMLSHLPGINDAVLRIVMSKRYLPYASPSFLAELGKATRKEKGLFALCKLRDTIEMCDLLGEERPVIRTVADLSVTHDGLAWGTHKFIPGAGEYVFPEPPLRGTQQIEPICDAASLVTEGREQRHCIASYIRRIVCGNVYAYRVLAPDRATLTVREGRPGQGWFLSEVHAARNKPVSRKTLKMVQDWLDTAERRATHDVTPDLFGGNSPS